MATENPRGLYRAIHLFEMTPEFGRCKATNARDGLIDIAEILREDVPVVVPPPGGRDSAEKKKGVVWSATRNAWMVRLAASGDAAALQLRTR